MFYIALLILLITEQVLVGLGVEMTVEAPEDAEARISNRSIPITLKCCLRLTEIIMLNFSNRFGKPV